MKPNIRAINIHSREAVAIKIRHRYRSSLANCSKYFLSASFYHLNDETVSANEDYANDLMRRTRVYERARGSERETRVRKVDFNVVI